MTGGRASAVARRARQGACAQPITENAQWPLSHAHHAGKAPRRRHMPIMMTATAASHAHHDGCDGGITCPS
eukprot:365625-Chlamydomonas_euryale.AAC.20